MGDANDIQVLMVALIFSCIFFFGVKIHFPRKGERYYRRFLSFAGGISVAYIFAELLPELEHARKLFLQSSEGLGYPFGEHRIYLATLAGFIISYGLYHWATSSRLSGSNPSFDDKKQGGVRKGLYIAVSEFFLYSWLITYLLGFQLREGAVPLVLYIIAMGSHFILVDFYLLMDYGNSYMSRGKNLLALAPVGGWGCYKLVVLPLPFLVTLGAFIAGAVIMNTMIIELPKREESKFWAFLSGAVLYTAILLLLFQRGDL